MDDKKPPIKLMIVDDDQDFQRLMSISLKKYGFEIVYAGSGEEAVAKLGENNIPDVIISDYFMGGMSGLKLCCILEETHPKIPIILTSYSGVGWTKWDSESPLDVVAAPGKIILHGHEIEIHPATPPLAKTKNRAFYPENIVAFVSKGNIIDKEKIVSLIKLATSVDQDKK